MVMMQKVVMMQKSGACQLGVGELHYICIYYKPSSVPHLRRASIIYLRRQSLVASSNLPPDIGRAALNCRYTRSCNPRDVLPSVSLPSRWALTPPSHPYPCGRSFSSTLLCSHEHQAVNLRGALRCSDFPPPPCGGSDGAYMRRKGTKNLAATHIISTIIQRTL